MRAVNLLPEERKTEAGGVGTSTGGGALTTARVAIVGGSLAVVVAGVVGYTFVGARGDVADKRDSLAAVQQQVDEARARAAAELQQKQQKLQVSALPADIKAQLDAFGMVAAQRVQWDLLLGDVSRVIPNGSWLSSLTLQGPPPVSPTATPTTPPATPAPQATPTGFVASGFALSQERVVRLLQQLELVPMLSDITLQRSERANVGTAKAFQFTLSANVRLQGVS
jgi:Tfp pilus assembly protein PilN